ncbi:hypothetical protein O1L55_23785, partial [Streptomyces albulus]|nr:hypothetical protein [Streptomyces noursei]
RYYFVQFSGWCLTSIPFVVVCVFAFIVETLSRFRAPLRASTGCPQAPRVTDAPTAAGELRGTELRGLN